MIASHSPAILAEIQVPVLASSVGAALTVVARKCGFRYQWCRDPLAHHTHTSPVPRIGGLAVFAAITVAWAFARTLVPPGAWTSTLPILLAAFPVLIVGAYDDLRHASPRSKVLAQLAGAAILMGSHWLLTGDVSKYELLLLAPWVVVSTNSFNLIDGVDGLAAGTAVILGTGLSFLNFVAGNFGLAVLAAITAAACLGFLPFNFLRPRIFLGDSGSLTVGFVLAAIAFATPTEGALPWAAIVLFGYPLTETALSIARRALKGRSLFRPDREHMHHKLRHAGLSQTMTALVLWSLALAFTSLGIVILLGGLRWIAGGCALVLFLSVARGFGYLRTRSVVLLRRRLGSARSSRTSDLPDIAGYLPFK